MTGFYRQHGKRWFDLVVAAPAMILFSPLFLALALAVRYYHGSPVLFRQRRPGKDGKLFNLYLDPKEQHSYLIRKLVYIELIQTAMARHRRTFHTWPNRPPMLDGAVRGN